MSYYKALNSRFVVHVLGPLFFVCVSPSAVLLLWYINSYYEGSFSSAASVFERKGFWSVLTDIWSQKWLGSQFAWTVIAAFACIQLLLMRVIPGRTVKGARTPCGHFPEYTDNGLSCFLITLIIYFLLAYRFQLINPTLIYENFGDILGALSLLSFILCGMLYVKGIFFPTTNQSDRSRSPLLDFFWGTELHPRVLGWDIKQFTNCRFGMMSWGFIILSFAHAQYELHGSVANSMLVSVTLQMVYIVKFYWWEAGYLRSLDIMHDRAGFYICWGCMVWVPGFYTITAQYLVLHPVHWDARAALLLIVAGVLFICLNFDADRQRKLARETHGKCNIWGSPAQYITAVYKDSDGNSHESILLTSGWWGLSRHFHYIPEILAALCWSCTAKLHHLMPYLYVIFLSLLLLHRAFRDDARCREKYSAFWTEYCDKVKYLIVPGLL